MCKTLSLFLNPWIFLTINSERKKRYNWSSHCSAAGCIVSFILLLLRYYFPRILNQYYFKYFSPGSVQFSHSVVSDFLQLHVLQHDRLPCTSSTPRACSNSYPSSLWCHPTISSCVIPFSHCLQSFPASGSSPMSQFIASGGQNIGVSASASVLPVNIQDWFRLGLTGLISLQS